MNFLNILVKNMVAKVVMIIIVIALLLGGFFILKYNPFGWNISFGDKPKIADTANVIEEVKKISEFTTASYYEEFVINEKKLVPRTVDVMKLFTHEADSIENEIVLLVKGKVRAGFNLNKITATDITISNDTISIQMPSPEIFDVIINPSDYEVFIETGKWSHEEIQAFQLEAKELLLKNATENNILDKATSIGKERISTLFKTFGFNVVNVNL